MHRVIVMIAVFMSIVSGADAAEYILPAFALYLPGEAQSAWSSEVFLTNPGPDTATVYEVSLIGFTDPETISCLPVQPSFVVESHRTIRVGPAELGVGIGCPSWAVGALLFTSDQSVVITSRVVNSLPGDGPTSNLLQGYGQEIHAVGIGAMPEGRFLLPAAVWHPNACGAAAFRTNVFLANPGGLPVTVSLTLPGAEPWGIVVDGKLEQAPFVLEVRPHEFQWHRIAGPDDLFAVCGEPVAGAIEVTTDGPLSVVGSVVDGSTGDPRTITPLLVSGEEE